MKKKISKNLHLISAMALVLLFSLLTAVFLPTEVSAAVQDEEWLDQYVYGDVDSNGDGIYERTSFEPTRYGGYHYVNRRRMVYWIWEAAGCPEPTEFVALNDVSEEDYFYNAVQWWDAESLNGALVAENTFGPGEDLARCQAITYIWYLAGKPTPTMTDMPYTDVGNAAYYYDAIRWAYEMGIVVDMENNLFRPAEVAYTIDVKEFFDRAADAGICNPITYYETFELNVSEITLDKMDTYQFFLDTGSKAVKSSNIVWVSSNPSVVSVNEDGYITANSKGTAYVYVVSFDGSECYVYCKVTVKESEAESGFDLKKDGYSIPNTMEGFGYTSSESGYKIPLERYQQIFGGIYTQAIYEQSAKVWNGNCFGMSVTSGLFYKGKLSLAKYTAEGVSLNEEGYDAVVDSDSTQAYKMLNSDSDLTKLIERYQVWQNSYTWDTLYQNAQKRYSTYQESFANVLERMAQKNETFLIVTEWKAEDGSRVGHSLVTDSSRAAEDLGDGWTRIYVYDPNNPYSDSFGTAQVHSAYEEAENRYVEVNQTTGQWRLSVGAGSSDIINLGYDEEGSLLKESKITFLAISDFPISLSSSFMPLDADVVNILYSSNDFAVYDSEQNLVYERTKGNVEYVNEEIVTESVNYGADTEKSDVSGGKLYLPKGEYSVEMEKGYVAYMSAGTYAGITAEDAVTVTNDAKAGMSVTAKEETAEVQVVLLESETSDAFTSVSMNLDVEESGCDILLKNEKLTLETETQQNVTLNITTNDADIQMEEVSTDRLQGMELENYTTLSLDYTVLFLEDADSAQLSVMSADEPFSGDIVWTSSDDSVAAVLDDGTVRAIGEGTAVITAAYDELKLSCKVTVVPKSPFADISKIAYYYQPVLWAVNGSITSGVEDNKFGPDESCTRGQAVTFIWRAFGEPEPTVTENIFEDIKSDEYYYKAVLWAVEMGITDGVDDTHFGPNATVTRGQFVTFLYRALGKPVYESENLFEDVKEEDYYFAPILWALENEVTMGIDDTHFGPNAICTRGHVVSFLYRALCK